MDMMHGKSDTEHSTVAAVAEALSVDVRTVSHEVGQARSEQRPYEPPFEANLLSRRQQRAISELIKAIAEERGTHGRDAAPTIPAGGSPAQGVQVAHDDPPASGVDVPMDEVARRRRALKADQIAADQVPNAARNDD
jgi:hypothetical protein